MVGLVPLALPLRPHAAVLSCPAQKISQLAAVNQESQFRALIQPEVLNVYSKAVSLEVGLQHFLHFLASMRQPILACYKLWGPSLPSFFQALEEMNMLGKFQKSISGFLATLPLIRECVPGASSFKLKSLAKTYLARNMSERSALAAVLTMRDLCRLLEVSPAPSWPCTSTPSAACSASHPCSPWCGQPSCPGPRPACWPSTRSPS